MQGGLALGPQEGNAWVPTTSPRAVDANTWGVLALGPGTVDGWFGFGAALRNWQQLKRWGGYGEGPTLWGVGYSELDGNGVDGNRVQAVYASSKSIVYPWGWTNHAYAAWDLESLSPVGYWKLDESSGVTAADSSGNGNDGTLHGNPVWQTSGGWFDGALDFDGRGDYVRVDRPVGFDFAPNSFSISAWIEW